MTDTPHDTAVDSVPVPPTTDCMTLEDLVQSLFEAKQNLAITQAQITVIEEALSGRLAH